MGVVFRRRTRAQGSPCVDRSVDFQGQEGGGEARARQYHVVLRQEIIESALVDVVFDNNTFIYVHVEYELGISRSSATSSLARSKMHIKDEWKRESGNGSSPLAHEVSSMH